MDTEVSTIKNLKNGLTILHTPTLCSNTKTSAIYVFVRVGSIDEEYHERGISHFLEHLLYKFLPRFLQQYQHVLLQHSYKQYQIYKIFNN